MAYAIQTPVTGQYLSGFAEPDGRDFPFTGPVQRPYPMWSHDRALALPATLENQAKVTLAGIFSFVLAS